MLPALGTVLSSTALVQSATLFVECALGGRALPTARQRNDGASLPRTVVVVPAHNEASCLPATLQSLARAGWPELEILVVADNCTDDTAEIARRAGATAIERRDDERRGKGYAISFALEHLASDPPDVVIILDADCAVSDTCLELLASEAHRTNRPVQAEYLLEMPEAPTTRSRVLAFAFLLKNRVRARGLSALGMPCQLTGSGMAFPWRVLRSAPALAGELVEDLVLGLELALLGYPSLFCPEARVTSVFPEEGGAETSQRRRWEHGHLSVLKRYALRLIVAGVRKKDLGLAALGLDLAVPPLTLLVLICLLATLTGLLIWLLFGVPLPFAEALAAMSALGGGLTAAWWTSGRHLLPAKELAQLLPFLAWKLAFYMDLLVRGPQRAWVRSARSNA